VAGGDRLREHQRPPLPAVKVDARDGERAALVLQSRRRQPVARDRRECRQLGGGVERRVKQQQFARVVETEIERHVVGRVFRRAVVDGAGRDGIVPRIWHAHAVGFALAVQRDDFAVAFRGVGPDRESRPGELRPLLRQPHFADVGQGLGDHGGVECQAEENGDDGAASMGVHGIDSGVTKSGIAARRSPKNTRRVTRPPVLSDHGGGRGGTA
jgi:hypothetical protein